MKRTSMETLPETEDAPEFTEEKLKRVVRQMKNGKAPGIDGFGAEIVKRCYSRIGESLLKIYNTALRDGVFPGQWKYGIVGILYKGDGKDMSEVKSYRPLTLLPVFGKMYEKLINQRLNMAMMAKGMYNEQQYGFRKGLGTDAALYDVKKYISEITERYALGVFLDIVG